MYSIMMKSIVAGVVASVVGLTVANAEDRTVVERPAITVPLPGVTVEKREAPVVEHREVETTGRGGCDSKTVRRDGPAC